MSHAKLRNAVKWQLTRFHRARAKVPVSDFEAPRYGRRMGPSRRCSPSCSGARCSRRRSSRLMTATPSSCWFLSAHRRAARALRDLRTGDRVRRECHRRHHRACTGGSAPERGGRGGAAAEESLARQSAAAFADVGVTRVRILLPVSNESAARRRGHGRRPAARVPRHEGPMGTEADADDGGLCADDDRRDVRQRPAAARPRARPAAAARGLAEHRPHRAGHRSRRSSFGVRLRPQHDTEPRAVREKRDTLRSRLRTREHDAPLARVAVHRPLRERAHRAL